MVEPTAAQGHRRGTGLRGTAVPWNKPVFSGAAAGITVKG
jgi:hypothetical protein